MPFIKNLSKNNTPYIIFSFILVISTAGITKKINYDISKKSDVEFVFKKSDLDFYNIKPEFRHSIAFYENENINHERKYLIFENKKVIADGYLFYGNSVPVDLGEGIYPVFEFYRYEKKLLGFKNIIRAHRIAPEEFIDISRIRRAYLERGIRFFYIEFDKTLKREKIIEFFEKLHEFINKYRITPAYITPSAVKPDMLFYLKNVLAAIGVIVLILYTYTKSFDGRFNFLMVNAASIITGVFASAMISNDMTLNGFIKPHFVKLCFYIPAIYMLIFLILYRNFKVNAMVFIIVFIFFIAGSRLSFEYAPGLELKIRKILEDIFIARPRFKELITQPLLIAGLYMLKKNIKGYEYLITAGFISQLSIVNTFFHVHTPLLISFLRVIYGISAGYIIWLIIREIYFNKKREFYVVGYFGFGNFGDELIKRSIETLFNENGFKYSFMENRKINFSKLIKSKCVVFAGGVFQDKTSFLSFLFYFFIFAIARILGAGCILLSYESMDINRGISKALFNLVLKTSNLSFSRYTYPDISILYITKFKKNEKLYDVVSIKSTTKFEPDLNAVYFVANKKEDFIPEANVYTWNSVDDGIEFLSKAKKIITERYHVAIIGLYFGAEVIPLNSPKTIMAVKEYKSYNIDEFKEMLELELNKILNV